MRKFLGVLLFGLLSCAQDPAITIDVVLAANQNANPILDISSQFQTGGSRGVFFLLDPLAPGATSIDATSGAVIESPSLSGLGLDPKQDVFNIDTNLLNAGTLYRLRMVAFDAAGTQTHVGTSDCPIFIGMQDADINICFGLAGGGGPLCGGTTSFGCCEGVTAVTCSQ